MFARREWLQLHLHSLVEALADYLISGPHPGTIGVVTSEEYDKGTVQAPAMCCDEAKMTQWSGARLALGNHR